MHTTNISCLLIVKIYPRLRDASAGDYQTVYTLWRHYKSQFAILKALKMISLGNVNILLKRTLSIEVIIKTRGNREVIHFLKISLVLPFDY